MFTSFQTGSLYMVGNIVPGSPQPPSPRLVMYNGKRENHSQYPDTAHKDQSSPSGSHAHFLIEFCAQRGRVPELAGPVSVPTGFQTGGKSWMVTVKCYQEAHFIPMAVSCVIMRDSAEEHLSVKELDFNVFTTTQSNRITSFCLHFPIYKMRGLKKK